jgi:hypothetical protein
MGNQWGTPGYNTTNATTITTYGMYKLPYLSSAINVNTENLQKCLQNSTTSNGNKLCIQDFVFSAVKNPSKDSKLNVIYFGPGRTNTEKITTVTQNQFSKNPGELVSKTISDEIQIAPNFPTSNCYDNFQNYDGENVDYDSAIESKKLFCFNGTFTILTVFVLIMLLIFININSKK